MKSTIKASDMALLLIEFVCHRHLPSSMRLRVSVDSRTTLSLMASPSKLAYTPAIPHFIAAREVPRKPVLTSQLHHATSCAVNRQ